MPVPLDLIADRARNRIQLHFYDSVIPEGVTPHPKPLSLGGGTPNVGFFPFKKIEIGVAKDPFGINDFDDSTLTIPRLDKDKSDHLISIESGFQYSNGKGHESLLEFTRELILRINKPGYEDWDSVISCGSGDSLHKAANLLINIGDTVLVEEFTFVPFIALVKNYGGNPVPVQLHLSKKTGGVIDVKALEYQLDNWSTGPHAHLKKPKVLYTIPTGQNPTGLSQSMEDKIKIYALAKKHNLMIIEDDPYGYIAYPSYATERDLYEKPDRYPVEKYVNERLDKSYLTIDDEGRVLRLETFSKLFSPGLRVGFIVGHADIIKLIEKHTNSSTRFASGVSQTFINNLLYSEDWQETDVVFDSSVPKYEVKNAVNRWLTWGIKVSTHYTRRRNIILDEFYKTSIVSNGWIEILDPDFGMFLVIRLNLDLIGTNYDDLLQKLRVKTVEKGVTVIFGKGMAFDDAVKNDAKSNFIRITTASAENEDEIKEASDRLVASIEEFFTEELANK